MLRRSFPYSRERESRQSWKCDTPIKKQVNYRARSYEPKCNNRTGENEKISKPSRIGVTWRVATERKIKEDTSENKRKQPTFEIYERKGKPVLWVARLSGVVISPAKDTAALIHAALIGETDEKNN